MQWICYIIATLFLFGCSWFSKSTEEIIELPAPRILQSLAPKKPAKREPGSLWSDDSKWNELYAIGPNRQPGDIITVKVTDSLKARVAQVVAAKTGKPIADIRNGGEPLPPSVPDRKPADVLSAEKNSKTESKAQEKEGDPKKKASLDTKTFEATILEVLPNGIYRVASNQGLKVGGPDEPYVSLEGNVREKEVAPDDTVSADVLLGTKLELVDLNSPNVISAK